jgi:hypothetical protein
VTFISSGNILDDCLPCLKPWEVIGTPVAIKRLRKEDVREDGIAAPDLPKTLDAGPGSAAAKMMLHSLKLDKGAKKDLRAAEAGWKIEAALKCAKNATNFGAVRLTIALSRNIMSSSA